MTRLTAEWLDDPAAKAVTGALSAAGHQALFVGGCVRNALIGASVTDLDIATDATPQQTTAAAEAAGLRAVPTGIEHGTITVVAEGRGFEVTTFRRDVETDGRRAKIAFAASHIEDAHRRDFTMNALYATPMGDVLDPLGGLDDLAARRVRFIDDPAQRIREDYLRVLRFFRFHAWYGDPAGGLDAEGLAACADAIDGLAQLSRERVGQEMRKLMSAPDPAPATAAMRACGALWQILPGAGDGILAVLVHVEEAAGLAPDPIRRLAALGGQDVAEALRLSRADAARLARLTEMMGAETGAAEVGYRCGAGEAMDILALRAALGGREIDADQAKAALSGSLQKMPLRAADLMPALSGPALGAALDAAEARWIASGFALGRDELAESAAKTG